MLVLTVFLVEKSFFFFFGARARARFGSVRFGSYGLVDLIRLGVVRLI